MRKEKYGETADVAIAVMKYGMGIPFYRLDQFQKSLGIPLPKSTQWDRVEKLGNSTYPVYEALIKEAAKGKVSFIDDTPSRINDFKKYLRESKSKR